jgi:hypothetical protein
MVGGVVVAWTFSLLTLDCPSAGFSIPSVDEDIEGIGGLGWTSVCVAELLVREVVEVVAVVTVEMTLVIGLDWQWVEFVLGVLTLEEVWVGLSWEQEEWCGFPGRFLTYLLAEYPASLFSDTGR